MSQQTVTIDGTTYTISELRKAVRNGKVRGAAERSDGVIYLPDGSAIGADGVLVGPGETPKPGICCPGPGWCGTGVPGAAQPKDEAAGEQ